MFNTKMKVQREFLVSNQSFITAKTKVARKKHATFQKSFHPSRTTLPASKGHTGFFPRMFYCINIQKHHIFFRNRDQYSYCSYYWILEWCARPSLLEYK